VHDVGDRVTFASDDARKIATVLRGRSGDRVHVVDSSGAAFATLLDVEGAAVHGTLGERLQRGSHEAALRVTIAQGIPKGQKMDLIVEKATELGVAAIVPVRSARVVGERTGDAKHERWQRLAKSAAQQCGRTTVPAVEPIVDWDGLLARCGDFERVYLAWELADVRPLREVFEADASGTNVLVIIGPEGGLGADEAARAVAAGAVPISLGTRILRTETVALVVLAALLYARGASTMS
jgi:16S rRNA (uracil1498-N3)-methyltransferase